MGGGNYIKIVINHPRRELFSVLQRQIIEEDVELLYFSNLPEMNGFVKRIDPQILIIYLTPEILVQETTKQFLKSVASRDVWVLFILGKTLSANSLRNLVDFRQSAILSDDIHPDNIGYNIRSLIRVVREKQVEARNLTYARQLFQCSKIIGKATEIQQLLEELCIYLPKFFPYDYWALFAYDPEFKQVSEFKQFIPPHRRNTAVITPNLKKLASSWLQRSRSFQVNIGEDAPLFSKLGEWGWGIRHVFFLPIKMEQVQVGGLIIGNANKIRIENEDVEFFENLAQLLSAKIYQLLQNEKNIQTETGFSEQLIHNRFSTEAILQISCKKISEIAKADSVLFWQLNRGFGFMFPKYSYVTSNLSRLEDLEKNLIYVGQDEGLERLLSAAQLQLVNQIDSRKEISEATRNIFKKLNYRNVMICAVKIRGEEIGYIIANRETPGDEFTPWELDQVSLLSEKIQGVLEDANTVKEANYKIRQLARIFELGNELKLELNLEAILKRITQSIRKTLGWNDVLVLRINEFRKQLYPIAKIGFNSTRELPIPLGKPYPMDQFQSFLTRCQKISHSYFYDSTPRELKKTTNGVDAMGEWQPDEILVIPVETYQKLLGYLVVHDPVDRLHPTEDRVVALEFFANQAAVAMQNSILYENLQASEARYRALAETMTLGLATCTPDANIVYVNPAFARFVGKTRKALYQKKLDRLFTADSRKKLLKILQDIIKEGKEHSSIENLELQIIGPGNEMIPVSTFAFPFYQSGHKIGAFFVFNDLRVFKRLERLKADFNSMIVHDLRSPMNVIQGFIELIRTRVVGDINSEQEEMLDLAKENVKKVLTLIDNFLVASKMEVGKFSIEPKISEIHSLIERILESHSVLMKNKKIQLESELNPNIPLLYFDSLRIEQVLNNLLSNAVKFSPEGGEIRITTDLYSRDIKGEKRMYARVGVHDNGPGIPENEQKRIFQKYEQSLEQNGMKSAGTGLGLSICKEIIGLHGGEIWVESEPGKGSHFYFTLPIEPHIDKLLK
ncbi:MAG: hypothetical protein Kow0037_08730 [Calditrichia bacterium]